MEWFEIEPNHGFQVKLFRNETSARMLVIEQDDPHYHGAPIDRYTVRVLTPALDGRPRQVKSVVSGAREKQHAMSEAWKYMSDNGGIG